MRASEAARQTCEPGEACEPSTKTCEACSHIYFYGFSPVKDSYDIEPNNTNCHALCASHECVNLIHFRQNKPYKWSYISCFNPPNPSSTSDIVGTSSLKYKVCFLGYQLRVKSRFRDGTEPAIVVPKLLSNMT